MPFHSTDNNHIVDAFGQTGVGTEQPVEDGTGEVVLEETAVEAQVAHSNGFGHFL